MSGENESVAPSLKDSSRGGSFKGSEASSHQGQELTDDQKKMMFRARMFMCFLFVLFIICAVLEDARLPLCALQLIAIGMLCMVWEEESYVYTSDAGIPRKLRGLFCQLMVTAIPLATASWILMIYVGNLTETPVPE
mmetsp:Transcript_50170/g.118165  ORF Transcript_50170/g.118165 Transcript_50170/m.118165 type:complete len:137 (-) Transcript_50170:48-458(-)